MRSFLVLRPMTKSWQALRGSFMCHFVSTLMEIQHLHALTILLAEEDCAISSLVKGEVQDGDGRVSGPEDEDEKGDKEDSEETGKAQKYTKLCKYLKPREKNIADLKK